MTHSELDRGKKDIHGNVLEIIDFAPRFKKFERTFRPVMLVQKIRAVCGSPQVRVRLRPSFDYGTGVPDVTVGSNHLSYLTGGLVLRLTTDCSVTAVVEEVPFVLEEEATLLLGPDEPMESPVAATGTRFFQETMSYLQGWVRHLAIPFEWQDDVIRAAITLKLSSFDDTGAVVAAMTTSIPEARGMGRHWGYRYCWVRDAYFVVNALNRPAELERSQPLYRRAHEADKSGCMGKAQRYHRHRRRVEAIVVTRWAVVAGRGQVRSMNLSSPAWLVQCGQQKITLLFFPFVAGVLTALARRSLHRALSSTSSSRIRY